MSHHGEDSGADLDAIVDDILDRRRKIADTAFAQGRGKHLVEMRTLYAASAALSLVVVGLLVWIFFMAFETHPPRTCGAVAPCPKGQTCVQGACASKQPCAADSDCGGGAAAAKGSCLGGVCQPASCASSADCVRSSRGALHCDAATKRCVSGCAADGDCVGGEQCVGRHCAAPHCGGDLTAEGLKAWKAAGMDPNNAQSCASAARCGALAGTKGDLSTLKGRCYAAAVCLRASKDAYGVDTPSFCSAKATCAEGGAADATCTSVLGMPARCSNGMCVPVGK